MVKRKFPDLSMSPTVEVILIVKGKGENKKIINLIFFANKKLIININIC